MDDLLVKDFNIGEEREITIPGSYIRRVIEPQMYCDKSLENMLLSLADITSQTGREMSAVVYSAILRNLEAAISVRSRKIRFPRFEIVPSLGDFKEVFDPKFYNSGDYKDDFVNREGDPKLVVPVIHVHTHPSEKSYPSNNDLLNRKHGYQSTFDMGGSRFEATNPTMNIIIGTSHLSGNPNASKNSFTFYQLNGNNQALEEFLKQYDVHRSNAYAEANESVLSEKPVTGAFMRRLGEAGVCKYLHFPAVHEPDKKGEAKKSLYSDQEFPQRISKEHLQKIASTFGYKLKLKRLS